ncbi:MAG: 2OG-Fe(II) oxygenase [Saprospiraceae bacterium]|jgi:hypothetical protein|nr:2OG-Fe(II) oxygenase [Saprospiraceae bacterium]
MDTLTQANVLEVSKLSAEALREFFHGNYLALRVPEFCLHYAEIVANLRNKMSEFTHYRMAEDVAVKKIGFTIFETENKPEHLQHYFQHATVYSEKIRNLCHPYQNPMDTFHILLDENWPAGANLESCSMGKMTPCIFRLLEADYSDGLPAHQDVLSRDLPKELKFITLLAQAAGNIYLSLPEEGGELLLWDIKPDYEEYEALKEHRHDFIDTSKLSSEPIVMKPRNGELILFRSDHIHAVSSAKNVNRIALSCFVGYYGDDQPLTYWA